MKRFGLVLFGLLILPLSLLADTYTFYGTLADESGEEAIPNTEISVYLPESDPPLLLLTVISDENGEFEFDLELEEPLELGGLDFAIANCDELEAGWITYSGEPNSIQLELYCGVYTEGSETLEVYGQPISNDFLTWEFYAVDFGEVVNYEWTVDGLSFNSETVTYTYNEPGIYPVELTATFSSGIILTDVFEVIVGDENYMDCTAYFYADSAASDFETVHFINASEGYELEYLWDFGDGNFSTEAYPTHEFAESEEPYEVCLTINGLNQCIDNYCLLVSPDLINGIMENESGKLQRDQAKDGTFIFTVLPEGSNPLSTNEIRAEIDLGVYPNPNSGVGQFVLFAEAVSQGHLVVADVQGRIIENRAIALTPGENRISFDTPLSDGIYIVRFQSENASVSEKFVVSN